MPPTKKAFSYDHRLSDTHAAELERGRFVRAPPGPWSLAASIPGHARTCALLCSCGPARTCTMLRCPASTARCRHTVSHTQYIINHNMYNKLESLSMISYDTWAQAHSAWAHAHAGRGQMCVDTTSTQGPRNSKTVAAGHQSQTEAEHQAAATTDRSLPSAWAWRGRQHHGGSLFATRGGYRTVRRRVAWHPPPPDD